MKQLDRQTQHRLVSILRRDGVSPLTIAKVFCLLNGTTLGELASGSGRTQNYLHSALIGDAVVGTNVRQDVRAILGIDPWGGERI